MCGGHPTATPPTCPRAPAMQQVLDNLLGLPSAPGAADLDLIFLRGIMESPIVRSLAKVPGVGGTVTPPGHPQCMGEHRGDVGA